MSNRIVAGIAGAALAVGILVGAAGTVLVHDAATPVSDDMGAMHTATGGSMGQTMEMVGGAMMGGGDSFAEMNDMHRQHHGREQ